MKRTIFFFLLVLTVVSCSRTSKIQSEAEVSLRQFINEAASSGLDVYYKFDSVVVDKIETKFTDDSLCILNAIVTGYNGSRYPFTSKFEYIYLVSRDKAYETVLLEGINNVFIEREEYEKNKKSTMFETLSYNQALRHISIIKIITGGRTVGNVEGNTDEIPMILNTGLWDKTQPSDSFRVGTIRLLEDMGYFSPTRIYDLDSGIRVELFVTSPSDGTVWLRLTNTLIKDNERYLLTIVDADGIRHFFNLYYIENRDYFVFESHQLQDIRNIFKRGGKVICKLEEATEYKTAIQHYFTLHLDGYNEAIKLLN